MAKPRGMALLLEALAFAAYKHTHGRRREVGNKSRVGDPIALARLLSSEGAISDERTLAAAVLHNITKVTNTTPAELRRRFGKKIASVVAEASGPITSTKGRGKPTKPKRAAKLSKPARLIKLADSICFVRELAGESRIGSSKRVRGAYFDMAKEDVKLLQGVDPGLERVFARAYRARP